MQFDRHAGLQQALRVADGFVAVRIELRAGDVGGGQAGQIVGPRRGGVRRGGRGAQVVPPRCGDLVARHEGRIGEVPCRPRLLPVIELGLVEQLEADRRPLLVTRPQRHRGREPRAGSVAADRDPLRVDAELGCVLGRPGQRGVGVVQGGREPMLGRQAVAHRDHDRPGAVRDPGGPRMLGVQVAHDKSAAVQPDDGALRAVRAIDPHRHVRIGGHRAVLDLHSLGVRCRRRGGQLGEVLARGDRVGQVGRGERRDECFQFGDPFGPSTRCWSFLDLLAGLIVVC